MLNRVKRAILPYRSLDGLQGDSRRLTEEFLMKQNCITDVERAVKKCKSTIVRRADEILLDEFYKMKDDVRTNCLKRGNFESCKGTRYLVLVDGSDASWRAFHAAVKKATSNDSLFVVLIWRSHKFSGPEKHALLLNHAVWTEAKRILQDYERVLINNTKKVIDYTLVMPGAWEPRGMAVIMCNKWKIEGVFLGRHRREEHKHNSATRATMTAYLKQNLSKNIELFPV
jgi:hypothetical protein